MIPRFLRILSAIVIAHAAVCATSVLAQEGRTLTSRHGASFAESDNVNELYVAIMGEVDTPGTYRLDSSSLKMHRVIQCARGFTADASMAIRVIRPGRIRQTEIFSEKTDSPLMPGDLLLVESKRTAARSGKFADVSSRDSQTIRAGYEEGTIRAGVQIALLNVLDYPLVLRVRPDQANATYLVQALGQPTSLLANSRVITPDVPGRQTSDSAKRSTRMDDGSVMVFEPGKVNRSLLPVTLPKPIDGEIAMASQAGLNALRYQHSPDLRNLGQHPFWSNSDPFASNSRTINIASTISRFPSAEAPNALDRESQLESDVILRNSHEIPSQGEDSTSALHELGMDSQSDLQTIAPPLSSEELIRVQPAEFPLLRLLIIVVTFGAVIGFAVLLRQVLVGNQRRVAKDLTPFDSANQSPRAFASNDAPVEPSETISIPIRPHSDASPRSSVNSSLILHDDMKEQQPPTNIDATTTPLAKALLQLQQRRIA